LISRCHTSKSKTKAKPKPKIENNKQKQKPKTPLQRSLAIIFYKNQRKRNISNM